MDLDKEVVEEKPKNTDNKKGNERKIVKATRKTD
jgi:hypothetical protein